MTSSFDLHPQEKPRTGIVVEGMPGAGKTTTLAAIVGQGQMVLGEYTDGHAQPIDLIKHPHHDDEHPHLTNWLRKDAQVRHLARAGSVITDRNWLTALGWAASVNVLPDRTSWAYTHLTAGVLTLPERWIILDCSVETSLARRHDRLDSTHPWADPDSLHRLRTFYTDPVAPIARFLPELADLISSVPVVRVDAEASRDAVGRALSEAMA
jgi:thymidylate kinase